MQSVEVQVSHRRPVVVFDLETTGLEPRRGHRIVEIGAVRLVDDVVTAEFSSLVRPNRPVPHEVSRIHGLRDAALSEAPQAEEVFPRFARFIRTSRLVAHNAAFDIAFLRIEFSRFNMRVGNPVACTLAMARKAFPGIPNYGLDTVAKHVLGSLPGGMQRHRALDDARLTAKVWLAIGRVKGLR